MIHLISPRSVAVITALLLLTHATDADETRWIGGMGSTAGESRQWRTISSELTIDEGTIGGVVKAENNRIYQMSGTFSDGDVTLRIARRETVIELNGQLTDEVLSVTGEDPTLNRLILRRVSDIPETELNRHTGIYEIGPGHRISFRTAGADMMAMTDYRLGTVRYLYADSPRSFVAGPGIAVAEPVEITVAFDGDSARLEGGRYNGATARRRPLGDKEAFEYPSFDETIIRGSLYLPSGQGPHPAIVWVHGSGMASRERAGSWPLYFADLGFAVLAVDKRGVGESEGNYRLPDGGRDNFPHMRRRARDVAAAVAALGARPDIRADQIGLAGASQAGWVIPMTTVHTDVAFVMILSGGTTPLSVEGRFSRIAAEDDSGTTAASVDELIEQLRNYEPKDPGIDNELAEMSCPGLWLYGLKDRSNPSQLCV